jgi:hypothetical protein
MNRAWFYQQMTGNGPLMADLTGGIHQSTKLDKAPEHKPFIMYRSIAHRPRSRGDDEDITRDEVFLVFVHDVPGDYLKIDDILGQLKAIFNNAKDTEAGIARCTWLEDSEDFRDEDMGTIMKYARFNVRYLP